MAVISNGDRFSSFQELNDKIRELEISENVEFYKRDVRTIAGARKRNIKRHINENLVVYSAKYAWWKEIYIKFKRTKNKSKVKYTIFARDFSNVSPIRTKYYNHLYSPF